MVRLPVASSRALVNLVVTCRCITPTSVCLCVHARQRACVGVCIRARNWRKRTHHPAPPTMSGTLHDCAVGALPRTPRNVRVAVCRTSTEGPVCVGPLWLQPPREELVFCTDRVLQVLTKMARSNTDEMARRHLLLPVPPPVVVKSEARRNLPKQHRF